MKSVLAELIEEALEKKEQEYNMMWYMKEEVSIQDLIDKSQETFPDDVESFGYVIKLVQNRFNTRRGFNESNCFPEKVFLAKSLEVAYALAILSYKQIGIGEIPDIYMSKIQLIK